ncbi:DUF3775 domain-containing protein [Henriciella aquimarina]|uniref:DUF3775 domain-containing protein n=1 Tax=Henriciella aquimarina TaxID=545261 RepID=UPI0009FC3F37|nr:DUF3775 domain-containing protein [Henriciella aquimarina]
MADRSFDLTIDPTIAYRIAELAREYESEDFDPSENEEEDIDSTVVPEDGELVEGESDTSERDPRLAEIAGLIEALDIDDQHDLLALVWYGRGDFDGSWAPARRQARETEPLHVLSYIEQTPLAGEYLFQALDDLGYPAEDYGQA